MPPIAVSPQEWQILQDILLVHAKGLRVYAFGSRVTASHKPMSDLDLMLAGDGPVDVAQVAALVEAFSNSDLPWKVDLVDRAQLAPDFLANIQPTLVRIR